MSENKDTDGVGSNVWDFLQTVFSNTAVIKTVAVFTFAGFIMLTLIQGWLDGQQMVDWFKDIWHTIKGTGP